jgi:hypothetical protein
LELTQSKIHLMIRPNNNTLYCKNILVNLLLIFVLSNTDAQIRVENIPVFDTSGNMLITKDTLGKTKILNLYQYKRTKDDTLIVIKKLIAPKAYCVTKYYATYNKQNQLTYLKYKERRSTVDGYGGAGIYVYKYDENNILVREESYRRHWFKYNLICLSIYNPSTKKVSYYDCGDD